MIDAPLTDGVSLFIWIVCILAGLGAALTFIDVKTSFSSKKESNPIDEKEGR